MSQQISAEISENPVTASAKKAAFEMRVGIILFYTDKPFFIHRALSSILSQTHQNWHLYLIIAEANEAEASIFLKQYKAVIGDRLSVIKIDSEFLEHRFFDLKLKIIDDENFISFHNTRDSWHPDFLKFTTQFLSAPSNTAYVAVRTDLVIVKEKINESEIKELNREIRTAEKKAFSLVDLIFGNPPPSICLLINREAIQVAVGNNSILNGDISWDTYVRLGLIGDFGSIAIPLAYHHSSIEETGSHKSIKSIEQNALPGEEQTRYINKIIRNSFSNKSEASGLFFLAKIYIDDIKIRHNYSGEVDLIQEFNEIRNKLNDIYCCISSCEPKSTDTRKPYKGFDWISVLLEIEISKLCCSIGMTRIGEVGWNHAISALSGENSDCLPSIWDYLGAVLQREIAKLICTLGDREVGEKMWNAATDRMKKS